MILNKFFDLDKETAQKLNTIKGPIMIIGAGGFVGANIFSSLLNYRKDVFALSTNPVKNKRFELLKFPKEKIIKCDVNNLNELSKTIAKIKPKTVFNLSAYGAYSTQQDALKIYNTNFISVINIIEELKKYGFQAYVHAGSSSEYGENSVKPKEEVFLTPNSHYAVSKAAVSNALYYYGKLESLPVIHLRLYSVYGPLEEEIRLISTVLKKGEKKEYPPLASPTVTRDFIHTIDVTRAFILASANINDKIKGEAFNIGTGKKTSIKELMELIKEMYKIKTNPKFGKMENRVWDHGKDWFADTQKAAKVLNFKAKIGLKEGLRKTSDFNKILNEN